MMSSYSAMPRQGHLLQLFHIFAFLKTYHNSRMVFDPSYPHIDDVSIFPNHEWNNYFGDGSEQIPEERHRPLAKELLIIAFVDADFATDMMT